MTEHTPDFTQPQLPFDEIPYGYCQCGCGRPVKGRNRYIVNHRGKQPLADRFWKKVEKSDGCWNWTAQRRPGGYGTIVVSNRHEMAHRVSWTLNVGSIPQGLKVLHRCDNPACVNPEHLFLGTSSDNIEDMISKQRNPRGEQHGHAKLTWPQVRLIRELRSHYGKRRLAKIFGVSPSTIQFIWNGDTWQEP